MSTHESTEEWGIDRAQLGHGSHCRGQRQGIRLNDLEITQPTLSTTEPTVNRAQWPTRATYKEKLADELEFKRVALFGSLALSSPLLCHR